MRAPGGPAGGGPGVRAASSGSRLLRSGSPCSSCCASRSSSMLGAPGEARGSALSRGPDGWLAARRYLEARGVRVAAARRAARPLRGGRRAGHRPSPGRAAPRPKRRSRSKATCGAAATSSLAYSGQLGNPGEMVALEGLGLPLRGGAQGDAEPRWSWRRFARQEWDLRPAADARGAAPVRVWAPRWPPELPKEAEVLFRAPRGRAGDRRPARATGAGSSLLPADAFANARLASRPRQRRPAGDPAAPAGRPLDVRRVSSRPDRRRGGGDRGARPDARPDPPPPGRPLPGRALDAVAPLRAGLERAAGGDRLDGRLPARPGRPPSPPGASPRGGGAGCSNGCASSTPAPTSPPASIAAPPTAGPRELVALAREVAARRRDGRWNRSPAERKRETAA